MKGRKIVPELEEKVHKNRIFWWEYALLDRKMQICTVK